MPVVVPEDPTHVRSHDESIKRSKTGREAALENFHESVTSIAGLLGDMSSPLRRSARNPERFLVEDAFACMWKDSKVHLGQGNDEVAKAILRAQGGSAPFMNAVHALLRFEAGNNPRLSEEQAKRFSVALRFAVHLAPDGGDLIHQELDKALHPSRSSCPLAILNAYLAHKVRKAS